MIKAIPTKHRDVKFKSKLEAGWAKWLDENSIVWSYETEGFRVNNEWYLPDFWLPKIRTIIEVKGMIQGIEKAKRFYNALQKKNMNYVLLHLTEEQKGETPQSPDEIAKSMVWWSPHTLFILGGSPIPSFYDIDNATDYGYVIIKCKECGATSLSPQSCSFECRACGGHDGDSNVKEYLTKILKTPKGWN